MQIDEIIMKLSNRYVSNCAYIWH